MSLDMTIRARVATADEEADFAGSDQVAIPAVSRDVIAGVVTFAGLLLSSALGLLLYLR